MLRLEDVAERDLHATSVAVEYLVPVPKKRVAGNQERTRRIVIFVLLYRIDVTRRVLRVIKDAYFGWFFLKKPSGDDEVQLIAHCPENEIGLLRVGEGPI